MIFTDADKAAIAVIDEVYPHSLHKLCIYHTMENIRKNGGGLGPGVLLAVFGKFQAAAYAQTEGVSGVDFTCWLLPIKIHVAYLP